MSLQDEIRELNEDRQIELDQKRNARVRALQMDLAGDTETARCVPAALTVLATEHRKAAKEAAETLEMIDIGILTPRQGEIVDSVRNRVRHVLTLLANGAAIAQRAVSKVDGLRFEEIRSWSPTEYARGLRNDLRGASSAPQVVRQIMDQLPIDMESIRKLLKDGPRREPQGSAASVERVAQSPGYAASQTQGT